MSELNTIESWANHLKSIESIGEKAKRKELIDFFDWFNRKYRGRSLEFSIEMIYSYLPIWTHGSLSILTLANQARHHK